MCLSVFQNAASFTDNNLFCSGSWEACLFDSDHFEGSGITDFTCGDSKLRSFNIKYAINEFLSGEAIGRRRLSVAHSNVVLRYGDLPNWDVSHVTNMAYLFAGRHTFNHNLEKWLTTSLLSMKGIFVGCSQFNSNLTNFNTSKVTNMESCFQSAANFNGDISSFNTLRVTNMRAMFSQAKQFNRDLTSFVTSSVTNFQAMFNGATKFNGDLSSFATLQVIESDSMGDMFASSGFKRTVCGGNWKKHSEASGLLGDIVQGVDIETATIDSSSDDWTLTLCNECYTITATAGTVVTQGSATGTLKTSLSGATTSIVISAAAGVTFVADANVVIANRGRIGCCPAGSFMSTSLLDPFSVADSCSMCSVGTFTPVENDDTGCQICARGTCSGEGSTSCSICASLPGGGWISGNVGGSGGGGNDRSSGVLKVVDDYFSNDPAKRASARKKHGDIENWDVSRITNMDNLFLNKTTFNADLSNWNTSRTTSMNNSK